MAVAGGFIELSAPPLRDAVSDWPPAATHPGRGPADAVGGRHSKGDVPARWPARPAPSGLAMTYAGRWARILSCSACWRTASRRPRTAPPVRTRCWSSAGARPTRTPRRRVQGRPAAGEGRDYEFTETAFVSLARPAWPKAWSGAAVWVPVPSSWRATSVRRRAAGRAASQAAAFADAHPGLDIRCSDVLGDCDQIAGLVIERYREAISGDIRMNCDMCQYRTALPAGAPGRGAAATT